MRLVTSLITVLFVMLIVFTAVNWSVLTASTPLSFVVFSIEGPLGVILLAFMLGLVLLVALQKLIEQEFKTTRASMEEANNGLIAHLGYLDDKLKGSS